eukprot:CAMPEP_0184494746 /NCGR_PEP_ID=MMETSP0113_2-20130426/29489_1 /TAXON_ID=91329 /ORGANISM="Norrisiella sphaerica, Strain BC52" /LENGTH=476 /DNA_ID=CAMNT_0026880625 /DNA_START=164 /DNA_END=1591 /DNA_ORIENTATION=-
MPKKGKKGKKNKGPVIAPGIFQKLLQYVSFRQVPKGESKEMRTITVSDIKKFIEFEDPEAEEPSQRPPDAQIALVCGNDKEEKFKGKPLTRAVQVGNLDICKCLIQHKAEIYTDHLIDAIKLKSFDICSLFLEDREKAKRILHSQMNLRNSVTPGIPTPHHAAIMGYSKIMKLILDKDLPENCNVRISEKADVHAGRSALHMAAEKGHVEVINTMLMWHKIKVIYEDRDDGSVMWEATHNVQLDLQDKKGSTALGIAAETGMIDAVKTLTVEGSLAQLRQNCARYGDVRALEAFLNPKRIPNQGLTAVQWAAYRGDFDMVEFLVGQGMIYDIDDVRPTWFPELVGDTYEPDLRALMEHEFSPSLLERMEECVFRGERTWDERQKRRQAILKYLRAQEGFNESKFTSYVCMVVAAYDVCYCDEDHILAKKLETQARLEAQKKERRERLKKEEEKEREEAERLEAERQRAAAAKAAKE